MVAIGEGAKAQVEKSFAAMGTNLLIVMPGSTTRRRRAGGFGSMPTLTWDDLAAIQREVPSVQYAAPQLRVDRAGRHRGAELDDQRHRHDARLLRDPQLADRARARRSRSPTSTAAPRSSCSGRPWSTSCSARRRPGRADACASSNIPFEVVGVLARKGQSPTGQDYDDALFIPSTTFQTKIQGGLQKYLTGAIMVSARSSGRHDARAAADHGAAARAPPPADRAPTTTSRSATWPRSPARSRRARRR